MRRRVIILAAVLGLAVLGTVLVSSGGAAGPRTFSVIEQDRAQARTHLQIQPADVVATTFTLFRGSRTVGTAQNACVAMPDAAAAAAGYAQCTQTFFFHDGQVVVTRARFPAPHVDAAVVVGGTGAYRLARGTATFARTSNPIRYLVTFALKR